MAWRKMLSMELFEVPALERSARALSPLYNSTQPNIIYRRPREWMVAEGFVARHDRVLPMVRHRASLEDEYESARVHYWHDSEKEGEALVEERRDVYIDQEVFSQLWREVKGEESCSSMSTSPKE